MVVSSFMKSISGNASYIVNVSSRYIVNVSLIVHVNNEEGLIVTRYKCWGAGCTSNSLAIEEVLRI